MEAESLFRKLGSLAQMDRDAVSVYDEAMKHVTDDEVMQRFRAFQAQHEQHAKWLVDAIEQRGGIAPNLDVDFMGRMADWVTGLRSRGGTEGALHAMHTAEEYHNRRYTDAHGWDVADAQILEMLERFHEDEKRHLQYVEQKLAEPARR